MTETGQTPRFDDDEIDLRELFKNLWAGKWFIALCIVIAIAAASVYLRQAERKYTVTYIFQPVSGDDSGPNLSGLGGLASLAGVSIPSGGSSDFLTFKALLQTEEVAQALMADNDLIRDIFSSEWNEDTGRFQAPPSGAITPFVRSVKKLLTGEGPTDYVAPNAVRLSNWMGDNFSASEDRDTGFLTLSSESAKPELLLEVMSRAAQETDRIIKDRFVDSAEETVAFYQSKLASSRSREHREALAQLITQEDQKLMLASNGRYFVAEPLTTPSISLNPTSPKSSLVLALAVVLGGFIGAAVVLIRKAFSE